MSVEAANAFISRWSKASPSERANSQLFLSELCDLLAVPHRLRFQVSRPPVPCWALLVLEFFNCSFTHADGSSSTALASYKEPVTPELIAKRFARAKPADVSEILETLCTMGHAHRGQKKGTYLA
jgi:hypothetical protein